MTLTKKQVGAVEAVAVQLEQKLNGTKIYPHSPGKPLLLTYSRQIVSEGKPQDPANDRVPDEEGSGEEEEEAEVTGVVG